MWGHLSMAVLLVRSDVIGSFVSARTDMGGLALASRRSPGCGLGKQSAGVVSQSGGDVGFVGQFLKVAVFSFVSGIPRAHSLSLSLSPPLFLSLANFTNFANLAAIDGRV
jgi:hypothetical protein